MAEPDELVTIKSHLLEELRFYGFAGICVIRFQQLDDYLCRIFEDLVGISKEHSTVIFGSIRTVQRRCHVLSKLLDSSHPALSSDWRELVRRVKKAEDNRNSIAHGLPVYGGTTVMYLNEETNTLEVGGGVPAHFGRYQRTCRHRD